ncbi:MAG: hypothetical protein ACPL0C_04265 [Candidatus Bathyarchaeales archaeon]
MNNETTIMKIPIKVKKLKNKNGKIIPPDERAEMMKNIVKIIHTTANTGTTMSPDNIKGIKTGLPLHKTFSST